MEYLKKLMSQVRGVSYKKSDASRQFEDGKIPILRAGTISDSKIIEEDYVFVPKEKVTQKQILKYGDILIAASSGSLSVVGKAAMIENDIRT